MQISPVLTLFIMQILQMAIPVVVTSLTAVLTAFVFQLLKQVKAKISAENLADITSWIDVLVKAAEQSGLKLEILKTTAERKAWVIAEAQKYIDEHGFKGIDVNTISNLIEAAILDGVHKSETFGALAAYQPGQTICECSKYLPPVGQPYDPN